MSREIIIKGALFLCAIHLYTAMSPAQASCGAAFCTLNTHWETQGAWTGPGMRADLRYEYINQDQPLAGRERISVGAVPHHHDEVKTLNRNLVTTLDYSVTPTWGVSLQAPWVDRLHKHIHNHLGGKLPETWNISGLGDIKLIARHQLTSAADSMNTRGLMAGVKLPTGQTDATNPDGDRAEASLQPGSGTTDVIAGMYVNGPMNFGTYLATGFIQAQIQAPLNVRAEFRPGNQYTLDVGMNYLFAPAWSGLLQINMHVKDRDRGANAEPLDSGASFVWLSPGVTYSLNRAAKIYGFIQLPLYQRVNGVQLTAGWSTAAGLSWHF